MANFVLLLRGINVGGNRLLPMAELRKLLADLGCEDVSTYIQSGNAVFRHRDAAAELSARIEAAIESQFGFEVAVLVLPADRFRAISAANPFASESPDAKTLHLWFLESPAVDADIERMAELAAASEQFEMSDDAFWLLAPEGIGRSRLAATAERCLGVPATARNWRTLGKINELLDTLD